MISGGAAAVERTCIVVAEALAVLWASITNSCYWCKQRGHLGGACPNRPAGHKAFDHTPRTTLVADLLAAEDVRRRREQRHTADLAECRKELARSKELYGGSQQANAGLRAELAAVRATQAAAAGADSGSETDSTAVDSDGEPLPK